MQDIKFHATTICCVKKDGKIAMAGDGQVSAGETILKGNAEKVRRINEYNILAGFAGSTADAFSLLEKFEEKLNSFNGNLLRSAVELAKDWRTDKYLRKLEAMMIVADKSKIFLLTGNGDIIEPEEGIVAIGSGGNFALAAGKSMLSYSKFSAKEIAKNSLKIASEICVYTNSNIVIKEL